MSKGGLSTSIGKAGASLNIGKHGVRSTVGIPGSGLSFTSAQSAGRTSKQANNKLLTGCLAIIISGVVLCLLGLCIYGILFWDGGGTVMTSTPSPQIANVATIIMQTANAAQIQTRAAYSPTPNITSTFLPTLTQPIPATAMETPIPTNTVIFVLPTQPVSSGGICSCSGDTYNCSDFSSHADAQACFNYCVSQGVGDIHKLDQNNDGNACESLP